MVVDHVPQHVLGTLVTPGLLSDIAAMTLRLHMAVTAQDVAYALRTTSPPQNHPWHPQAHQQNTLVVLTPTAMATRATIGSLVEIAVMILRKRTDATAQDVAYVPLTMSLLSLQRWPTPDLL